MTKFVETRFGYVRADTIDRIRDNGDGTYAATTTDGATVDLFEDDILGLQARHVVPALDGYSAVEVFCDEADGCEAFLTPIVAWRIMGSYAQSVTIDPEMSDSHAIMTPDGRVHGADGSTYADMGKYISARKDMWAKSVAARSAAK